MLSPPFFVFQASADCDLWYPTFRSIRYRLRSGKTSQTFVYRFDAETENNFGAAGVPGTELYRHPTHGDDANHIFKTIRHKKLEDMDKESFKVIQLMVNSFTNFAKSGDPSVTELNLTWPAVLSEDYILRCLNINEKISEVIDFPESDRMGTFDDIWRLERSGSSKIRVDKLLLTTFGLVVYLFLLKSVFWR